MNRIDIKMLHSKELRELRNMIREELDFRADVGSEIENKKEWVSATEWSARVQQQDKKEERERSYAYIEESTPYTPHIKERMESMRDWERTRK